MYRLSPSSLPLKPARFLGFWASTLLAITGLQGAKTPHKTVESRSSPDREYRLFVGVDIKILRDKDFGTVTDFAGFEAQLDGSDENRVDVRGSNRVRFEPATKVGRSPLSITDIETKRAFSARNDPRRAWASRQATMQAYQQDEQSRNVSILGDSVRYSGEGIMRDEASQTTFYNPVVDKADQQLAAFEAETAAQSDVQFYEQRGKESAKAGQEDAMIVEAMLSSPQPLVDAYVAGIARITKDGVHKDVIFFSNLDRIGPEPQKIRIRKEGLPIGFEILSVDLHVFREGQELVTDQSAKQFALTRDEALEYLTLAHTSSNRGRTLAAQPAWSLAPPELFAADNPTQFDYAMRVRVDDRGQVMSIGEDSIVPDHIAALVHDLVFIPALDNGVPSPSETSLNLRDFFR